MVKNKYIFILVILLLLGGCVKTPVEIFDIFDSHDEAVDEYDDKLNDAAVNDFENAPVDNDEDDNINSDSENEPDGKTEKSGETDKAANDKNTPALIDKPQSLTPQDNADSVDGKIKIPDDIDNDDNGSPVDGVPENDDDSGQDDMNPVSSPLPEDNIESDPEFNIQYEIITYNMNTIFKDPLSNDVLDFRISTPQLVCGHQPTSDTFNQFFNSHAVAYNEHVVNNILPSALSQGDTISVLTACLSYKVISETDGYICIVISINELHLNEEKVQTQEAVLFSIENGIFIDKWEINAPEDISDEKIQDLIVSLTVIKNEEDADSDNNVNIDTGSN